MMDALIVGLQQGKPESDNLKIAEPVALDASVARRRLVAGVTDPTVNATRAIAQWSGIRDEGCEAELVKELEEQIAANGTGGTGRHEELLAAHIETLNAMFYSPAENAFSYRGSPYMADKVRLALKVQAQVRATIQALADLKNPRPVAFVQQANIAHGPQQVNNGPPPAADTVSRVRDSENRPNELLEQQRNEWLDSGAAQTTVGADSEFGARGSAQRDREARRVGRSRRGTLLRGGIRPTLRALARALQGQKQCLQIHDSVAVTDIAHERQKDVPIAGHESRQSPPMSAEL